MIDTLALRTLVALDSAGSVTATADALGYTSAAISHQLQKLSRYLGSPVTERTGRGIALTPMGRELSRRGAELLQDLESLETDAGQGRANLEVGSRWAGSRQASAECWCHPCRCSRRPRRS
ncbi:helix-turn-helix domain-containing protein [Brevibacterium sp. UCMA 11754]|uniref:helix-turn-helix domain-containing protein n=1 Tax=Brevibacterium sp. UCMA 11754 TaxID=2749198 RepID=UPI001F37D523|nr:LysR family transcriptional regulator [Brevibacterium sp. UCMA 11754]